MAQAFVISMKFVGDASNAVAATNDMRAAVAELNQAVLQAGQAGGPQARINQLLGIGGDSGAIRQTEADIAAYGAELDNLRAKFNPLFAAERAHAASLVAINDAFHVGAIDADEFKAAVDRQEASFNAQVGAINSSETAMRRYNSQAKGSSFQTANLAAQINDIAVQMQSGQNPFQIALQQGTQINQVIGQQGAKGAVSALGAAFKSLINPVSLATIGIIGFGGLAIQSFSSLLPKVETATQALKRHQDEIAQIVQGYDKAQKAADDYFKHAGQAPQGAVQSNLLDQAKKLTKEAADFTSYASKLGPALSASGNDVDAKLGKWLSDFAAGKESAADLVTQLTVLGHTDLGPLGFITKHFVDDLADGALKAAQLHSELINLSFIQAGAAINPDTQFALDQKVAGSQSKSTFDAQLAAINARSPAQLAEIARKQKSLELDGEEMTAARKQQEIDQAGALAYGQAAHAISEADRARLLAANENISTARLSLELVGQGIDKTQRLTFVQQQLASAETAAAQNGVTVSQAYRAEIERLGAAYGDLQQKIALAKLGDDIAFDRSQLGRNPGEQAIANQLRPIYGNDQTGAQAQFYANQLRVNASLADLKDIGVSLTTGFLSDFQNDLKNGTSLWGALADSGANALDTIAQKLEQMAVENLFANAFGGSSGGGNWFSSILGLFGLGGGSSASGALSTASAGLSSIGHNAAGTDNWRGGATAVNEQGGEILNLPSGTQIIPHDVSMAMAQGSGNNAGTVVQFSPTTIFQGIGEGTTKADFKEMLDQRDEAWREQLPDVIAYALNHPRRRGAA